MKNKKRTWFFILTVCLISSIIFSGCSMTNEEDSSEEYDFSVFLGSLDEPIEIDSILIEYEKLTGLKIKPIVIPESKDNQGTLNSLLNETTPPAIYAVASDIDIERLSEGGLTADFSEFDSKAEGNSIPYILEGYGYAYDRMMFEELFGDNADTLINDLRKCTYDEWVVFIHALNEFINNRSAESFVISGNTYTFPGSKGEKTDDLNGVFAFPGASSEIYGYSIMDMLVQTTDLQTWQNVQSNTSTAAFQVMEPTLTTYVNGLDLITSNLAGTYSAGIRGNDFTNEEYYSIGLTDAMFMEGKAMFTMIGSRKFSDIESLNTEKAKTLGFLPVKMPYSEATGGRTSEGAVLNSSIPANIAYSLCINSTLPEDTQKQAYEFLIWFAEREEQWSNPLSRSIKTYVDSGSTLKYDYRPDEIVEWYKTIFDEKGVAVFLRKELWNDEYKENMKLYLTEKWIES